MLAVAPIQTEQQEQVIKATEACISLISQKLEYAFASIPVLFDLKGKAAGMYRVKKTERVIRYNPYIFARYFNENLTTTVPHEVAHYVVDILYGMRHTSPHGKEWRGIMAMLDADASVTCEFDLTGLPGKQYKRFTYACPCRQHEFTSIRHNRVLKGMRYSCRRCKQTLVYADG